MAFLISYVAPANQLLSGSSCETGKGAKKTTTTSNPNPNRSPAVVSPGVRTTAALWVLGAKPKDLGFRV